MPGQCGFVRVLRPVWRQRVFHMSKVSVPRQTAQRQKGLLPCLFFLYLEKEKKQIWQFKLTGILKVYTTKNSKNYLNVVTNEVNI